ncbi:MAG: TonB-dependent receptor [Rubrivivax sp.]|nr:TonB-dependent receptor [Rubrivivax sp.]
MINQPKRTGAVPGWPLKATALAACLCAAPPLRAQGMPASETVVITGNPLGAERTLQPAVVLGGTGLVLRRSATLGETLDGLPGVAASGFGPNASRPVIRGLDGDRVRLLENGGASVDASSLSFDHAPAIDPLRVERLEVLRGPAVLLYGGSAAGGVVNAIDNRIPRSVPAPFSARAELRAGGAASERGGATVLEGLIGRGGGISSIGGGLAWHVDAFSRRTDNPKVPRHTPVQDGVPLAEADRVRNAAAWAEGGALGASFVGAAGYAGVSSEAHRHRYGVPVEPDVTIRMQRERHAVSAGWKPGAFGLERVALDAARTNYRHEEVEGSGEVGTVFKSRGNDARIEVQHAPWAGLRGVVGAQWEALAFSALGEEAFVPGTKTRQQALFVFEELALPGGVVLSGGARAERVRVASDGDAPDAAEVRFGAPAARSFSPRSAAFGLRMPLRGGFAATASLASSQRAPTYYELFANGVHVATGALEVGDASLATERSRHAEAGVAWVSGPHKVEVQVFTTRFADYIALDATGNDAVVPPQVPGDPPEVFPEYAFRAVRARLTGFEVEARTRLVAGAPLQADLGLTLDQVRGSNLTTGEPLPRIAPLRARLALDLARGALRGGVVVRHAAKQARVPATDAPTAGYTMLDLWAMLTLPWPGEASVIARVGNVTDRLGYNAAAIATARRLTPLPGRAASVVMGWRW